MSGTTPNPQNDPFRYPFVTAVCPTYRHPELLASSIALWQAQDYPKHRRRLVILDDDPTYHDQAGDCWEVFTSTERLPSLPAKYNTLLQLMPPATELVLIWEDDDTYLPGYVEAHVRCLQSHDFSKPEWVYSDYEMQGGRPLLEQGGGRFHSSMGFTKDLIMRIGGWPDTKRADFDQQLIHALDSNCNSRGSPWDQNHIQYCYGWHTGAAHCQSTMRAPEDDTWYERGAQAYAEVPFVGAIIPKPDYRSTKLLIALGVQL